MHHLESDWEKDYNNSGTSLAEEALKVLIFLKKNPKINELIITKNKDNIFDVEYFDLYDYCIEKNIKFRIEEYGYGWIKNSYYKIEDLNITWCYATRFYYNKKDILLIPNWIKELNYNKILIGGCFEFACIQDLQAVLNSINKNYKVIKHLVVR